MQTVRHIILLTTISVLIHTAVLYLLFLLVEWLASEGIKSATIIAVMLAFIISAYYFLKKKGKKQKPHFLNCFIKIFTAQFVTIAVLNYSGFDLTDFLFKSFIFAFIVPISLLAIMFAVDGRSDDLLPSDLP